MSEDAIGQDVALDNAGQQSEGADPAAAPSPASEETHEEKSNGVQKRINELTAKRYEAERRADELEAKLAQREAEKPVSLKDAPVAPAMPEDTYDSEAMKAYHASMSQYSVELATAASKSALTEHQKNATEKVKQEQANSVVSEYASNALRDGVDLEKLKVAEQTINKAGISTELGQYIMMDKNGGKIVEYIYDNPSVMHELLALDPVSAGIRIASEIKTAALSNTPKVSGAPDPLPEISGGGVVEKDDFDRRYPGTTFT